MAAIVIRVDIAAPLEAVWREVADLGSHAEWMRDAETVEFLTPARAGVGTRMRVRTVVGPFHTDDLIEVSEWREPRSIGIRHDGLVSGTGRFSLAPLAGVTRLIWTEELRFPWWWGGRIAGLLAQPVLAWLWRRNLAAFKDRLESR